MRKLLIVIDMQNDFIDQALGTPEAVGIIENVKKKIDSYPRENVIATMDTHTENYMDTQEGKYLPVPHCIKGSEGWQIRPDIQALLEGLEVWIWQKICKRCPKTKRSNWSWWDCAPTFAWYPMRCF